MSTNNILLTIAIFLVVATTFLTYKTFTLKKQ